MKKKIFFFSTVAKEIKLRRKIKPINPFNNPTIPTTQMDTVYNHSDGSFIQTYVSDILPNKKSIKHLTQEDIGLMFSHINSTPRATLNGKTPYEAFEFLYGSEILKKSNVQKIEKDMATLQPYLPNIIKRFTTTCYATIIFLNFFYKITLDLYI